MVTMKLRDCCTIIAGQSPESKYYNTEGVGIPFFQGKADFGEVYPTIRVYCSQPTKIAEKDDILLSVRAPVGPTNLSPGRVCIGRGLTAIRPSEILNLKYLLHYFRYFEAQLQQKGTGTTFKAITQDIVKNLDVPIPSLDEQDHIVAKIEELFSELDIGVETLRKTKQQLAVYRQAVYASVYGTDDFRPITDFFDISGGLTKNSKRHELPIKMPYLRVANVYYNELDLSEIKYIGVTENEVERTLLRNDDLLFVEGNGSKEQIGRVAIWDGSVENCLHQNHLIKGRPVSGMLPQYALYYLISRYGRKQILDVASSTSGLYTLSTNKVRNLKIPYVDIEQQKMCIETIEARISVCDSIEKTVDTALQQAESMRQSILKQAFEGRFD